MKIGKSKITKQKDQHTHHFKTIPVFENEITLPIYVDCPLAFQMMAKKNMTKMQTDDITVSEIKGTAFG